MALKMALSISRAIRRSYPKNPDKAYSRRIWQYGFWWWSKRSKGYHNQWRGKIYDMTWKLWLISSWFIKFLSVSRSEHSSSSWRNNWNNASQWTSKRIHHDSLAWNSSGQLQTLFLIGSHMSSSHWLIFFFRQITIGWMVPPTQVNVRSQNTAHLNMFSRQNMRDHIGIIPIMVSKEWTDSLAVSQFTIQVIYPIS